MTYSSFDIESSISGHKETKRSFSSRRVGILCFATLALGVCIGIIIGHFGISNSEDSPDLSNNGNAAEIVGEKPTTAISTTVVTTTVGTSGIPSTTAGSDEQPGRQGVFLEGVSEAIIRDADPNITDWILREINASNIRENLRAWVRSPHIAGTSRDLEQADDLKQFWLDVGLDAAYTTPYDILLSYPSESTPNKVRLFNDTDLVLESPDNELNLTDELDQDNLPYPYLGYSGNGTVNGTIVYVNYGRLSDFEYLERNMSINVSGHIVLARYGRGGRSGKGTIVYVNYGRLSDFEYLEKNLSINVSGHIVMARYGRGGRSGKVRLAEERGALGVILYSDPADYVAPWATDAYPDSIWIPPQATSRGSIFRGTGDPLTPGYPAIASAFRYDESDPEALLPKIPAMPIGYDVAEQILSHLGGQESSDGWSGRLLNGSRYRIGTTFTDSNMIAELSVHTRNERRVAYNAFGVIHGETEPDRYVLLGNHRDSWVLGAIDPSSGTATMMELSRVLGQLVRDNVWRPRRTVIFCSWGAEEFGLIGSTEWIEENSKVLDFRSVAYINMDIAVTGNYSIRGLGSPPVFSAMYRAATKVPDPHNASLSVYDTWTERKPLKHPSSGGALNRPIISSPGGGSDYGTFQMRAGITCADFRYDQDYAGDEVLFYPLYHTSYETFYAVDELIDPGFKLHATIAMLSGELLRDLADSKLLPFNMTDYAWFMEHYYTVLVMEAAETLEKYGVNRTELESAIDMYEAESIMFHQMVDTINLNNPFEIRRVNDQMMQIERTFLDPASLPGRSQIYRHLIHSTTDYASFPGASFPGLKDAIFKLQREPDNERHIRELRYHWSVLVFTVQGAANSLKIATAIFRENL